VPKTVRSTDARSAPKTLFGNRHLEKGGRGGEVCTSDPLQDQAAHRVAEIAVQGRRHGENGGENHRENPYGLGKLLPDRRQGFPGHSRRLVEAEDPVHHGLHLRPVELERVDSRHAGCDNHEEELAPQGEKDAEKHHLHAAGAPPGQKTEADAEEAEPEKEEEGRQGTEEDGGEQGGYGQAESGLFQVMAQAEYHERCGSEQGKRRPDKGKELGRQKENHGKTREEGRFHQASCGGHLLASFSPP